MKTEGAELISGLLSLVGVCDLISMEMQPDPAAKIVDSFCEAVCLPQVRLDTAASPNLTGLLPP